MHGLGSNFLHDRFWFTKMVMPSMTIWSDYLFEMATAASALGAGAVILLIFPPWSS